MTWPPSGPVDQQVAHVLDAAAGAGRTLDDDVEDLLLLEDAADLDALQQRGLRPAHVTRRDAEAPAPGRGRPRSRRSAARRAVDDAGRRRRRRATSASCTRSPPSRRTSGSWPKSRTTSGSSTPVSRSRSLPVTVFSPSIECSDVAQLLGRVGQDLGCDSVRCRLPRRRWRPWSRRSRRPGSMLTQMSLELTLVTRSPVTARPDVRADAGHSGNVACSSPSRPRW